MRSLGETRSDEQLEQMIAEVDVDGKLCSSSSILAKELGIVIRSIGETRSNEQLE